MKNVLNRIGSLIGRVRSRSRAGQPDEAVAAMPVPAATVPVVAPAVAFAAPVEAGPSDFDVRVIGRGLWKKRFWILLPTIAAAVLAFMAVNTVTPRYKSEARILLDGRENVFMRANADSRENSGSPDAEAVTSQVQLVLSRDLARRIVAKNRLAELPEFDPVLNGLSPLKTVLSLVGIGRDPLRMTAEERVMEAYFERLTAYAVDKSRVITIEFQSTDPDLAARVANSIAEGFLELNQSARQDQAKSAVQWLSGEIDNLRKKVADAEARVEEFRSKTNLFVGLNNTTLSAQQLGELNTQLNTARTQKAEADSKARLIRGMLQSGRPIEASDVLNSELVRRLNEQRVTLSAQLAEQSSTLLPGHPRIKELKAQIADIDRQIRDEASKFARSLENDTQIAGGRLDTLTASLDQMKKQAGATNSQDIELRALEREAKAQRDLLESYLAKYREATTRENIDATPSDSRIISRAVVSNTPAYPKKMPIVIIATLAMFLLCSGIVVTGELLRIVPSPAVRRVEPAEFAEPVAQTVAAPLLDVARAAARFRDDGARRIAVIGTTPRSGSAMTALALARALAREGRVVLVDLAGPSPMLANAAADPGAPGLCELVEGEASFGDIITRDRLSEVHLVGAGQRIDSASALQSPRVGMALDALARVYDHVVVEAGALAALPHLVIGIKPQVMLVADSAQPAGEVAQARSRLLQAGFAEVAVVASAVDVSPRMAAA